MELDSEIQASKDKIQKEKGIRVHRWWDHVKGWLWIYMVMDCNWTWKQTDSCIICIKREKHVCSRTLSVTDVVHNYGMHPVSTDGERTWYPMACRFLKLRHHTFIRPLRKASLSKGQCSMSRTELNIVLMITFLVGWRNVN